MSFSLYAEVNHNRRGFQRSWDQKKAWEYSPPERRLVRFDRAGESVIVADLLAQIGHRFGIDASLTIDLGFSA